MKQSHQAKQWMWQNFLRACRFAIPDWCEPGQPRPGRRTISSSKRKRAGDVNIASDEEVDDNDDGDDEDLKLSAKWSITNTIVMMSVATDEGPFVIVIVIIVIHHCLVAGNLAARTRVAPTET